MNSDTAFCEERNQSKVVGACLLLVKRLVKIALSQHLQLVEQLQYGRLRRVHRKRIALFFPEVKMILAKEVFDAGNSIEPSGFAFRQAMARSLDRSGNFSDYRANSYKTRSYSPTYGRY